MSENPIDALTADDGSIDARRLHGHGSASPHAHVSREACRRLRVALLYGAELREHTRATDFNRSVAHYHAAGKCSHDHAVPPVAHTTSGHGTGGRWVIDE
jgi:hypothetical protein